MTRTVFHTRNDLENWRQALHEEPLVINQLEVRLREQEDLKNAQKRQRTLLNEQSIQPEKEKILDLEACRDILTLPGALQQTILDRLPHEKEIDRLTPELHETRETLKRLEAEAEQFRVRIDIDALENSLSALSGRKAHLIQAVSEDDYRLDDLNTSLSALARELEWKEGELRSLERHLELTHHHHLPLHETHSLHISHVSPHFGIEMDGLREQISHLRIRENTLRDEKSRLQEHRLELQNNIETAEREQFQGQRDLLNLRSRLRGSNTSLSVAFAQSRLRQVLDEKHSLDTQKTRLETSLEPHTRALSGLKSKHQEMKSRLEAAHRRADRLSESRDLSALSEALTTSRRRLQDLERTRQSLDNQIAEKNREISTLLRTKQEKTSRLQALEGNTWMHELNDSPENLVLRLSEEAIALVDVYEAAHPAGQSDNVRLCLAEMLRKSRFYTDDTVARGEKAREQYWQFCGMLWDLHDLLLDSASEPLKERLLHLMASHPADPSEARMSWQAFQYDHPQWRTLSLSQLLQQEQNAWLSACESLSDMLKKIPDHAPKAWRNHRRNGEALLAAIQQHEKKGDSSPGELKYLAKVLNKSRELTLTPGERVLKNEYKTLIGHNTQGKASLPRLIGGAMMMFLGTAEIIASLALHCLSLGLAAPLTVAGVAMGGTLLTGGLGLFASGFQKGMAKKMAEFEASATSLQGQRYESVVVEGTDNFEPSCPEEELPPAYEGPSAPEEESWYPVLSPGRFSVNQA